MNEFNKARLQQYAEYKDCFHVKICLANGKIVKRNFTGDVSIACREPLRIGVDQSSSQTGIAVKKNTGELVCLIDLVNTSCIGYNLYRSMLGLKLEQIFNNAQVEMCIVEKMWGGNKNSYEMLSNLGDFISGYKYILEGWSNAEISEILPNVWRSAYLASPEYKGMFTKDKVKVAAMKEGVKRYPNLYNYGYYEYDGNHINDSFDALGILEGYEEKTFSTDGTMRKVANTMTPTNHNYSYKALFANNDDILTELIKEHCPQRKTVEYEYNSDFTFYENVRRATSVTNKVVFMLVNDNVAKIQMMWRFGKVIPKEQKVYLVGWRDRISTKLDNY